MATHHGKHGVVMEGAVPIAEVKKFSIKSSAKTAEDTAMGDDFETHIAGETIRNWSGSLGCNFDQANAGQAALVPGASVTLKLYPEGSAAGANYLTGLATITEDDVDAEMASAVQRAFSFQGNGALTWVVAA